MRTILGLSMLLVLAASSRSAERDAALAILDPAIKAHGGEEALAKAQIMKREAVGVLSVGKDVAFKDDLIAQLPDRLHSSVEIGDQKARVELVINRDRGWQLTGGAVMELGKDRLVELREEAYVLWLTTLVPLKKDSAFELAPLPETRVNGQPAAGVKVGYRGHTDVKLYFDKRTNLLVKLERRAVEAGQIVDKEDILSDHKDFDGVKLPTRQLELTNGKKFTEVTSYSYKFPDKVEESVFAKP